MKDIVIYYDGDCPYCKSYKSIINIRKKYSVEINNAREHLDEINELKDKGFHIEDGILLIFRNKIYQGSEALKFIDQVNNNSTTKSILYSFLINTLFFESLIYPLIKQIRIITLYALGKKRIK